MSDNESDYQGPKPVARVSRQARIEAVGARHKELDAAAMVYRNTDVGAESTLRGRETVRRAIINWWNTAISSYNACGEAVPDFMSDKGFWMHPERNIPAFLTAYVDGIGSAANKTRENQGVSYTTLRWYATQAIWIFGREIRKAGGKSAHIIDKDVNDSITSTIETLRKLYKLPSRAERSTMGFAEVNVWLAAADKYAEQTGNIEYIDQNKLGVCLVLFAGLRFGSLYVSRPLSYEVKPINSDEDRHVDELHCLLWKDVILQKATDTDTWRTVLRIQWFKGFHGGAQTMRRYKFTPVLYTDDLRLDISLGFMNLGLRRGIFKDISTVDDIMNFKGVTLQIKSDRRFEPVFLQSTAKGAGINYQAAQYVEGADETFARIRELARLPSNMLPYSLRRNMINEVVGSLGTEMGRAAASHEPGSRTMEKHYVKLVESIDFVNVMYGSDAMDIIFTDTARLSAATAHVAAKEFDEAAVNRALHKFLLESPEYTNLEAQLRIEADKDLRRKYANDLRNLKKSARKLVKKHYINHLNKKAEALILSDEKILSEVEEELKQEKALRVEDDPEELEQVIQQVENGGIGAEGVEEDEVEEALLIAHANTLNAAAEKITDAGPAATGDGKMEGDEDNTIEADVNTFSGGSIVGSASSSKTGDPIKERNATFWALLRKTVDRQGVKKTGYDCNMCLIDDSIPQAQKVLNATKFQYTRHLNSNVHLNYWRNTISRYLKKHKEIFGRNHSVLCPWCEKMMSRGEMTVDDAVDHLLNSCSERSGKASVAHAVLARSEERVGR